MTELGKFSTLTAYLVILLFIINSIVVMLTKNPFLSEMSTEISIYGLNDMIPKICFKNHPV